MIIIYNKKFSIHYNILFTTIHYEIFFKHLKIIKKYNKLYNNCKNNIIYKIYKIYKILEYKSYKNKQILNIIKYLHRISHHAFYERV